ncbi:MAG: TIGR03557 family F420-dependent LLM class oxidoreductase [Candidatus Dormibacteraeota bacterium]|nr:TIGR03557 family F420-dependent LLM class oxidoreductase [Candidatus Dormibacteraeota bacterium]
MIQLGYSLSSEEHRPDQLIEQARRAEDAGFSFAVISDHFHPWISAQGQSPFVWSVLGGIARETSHLRVGTGVTCPLIRMHPAIVAQAAATTAAMFGDRFFLGVGTGERLNEHVLGDRWPAAPERRAMLEESVRLLRHLWQGGTRSFDGRFYQVEQARLYTLPDAPPPIYLAAVGDRAAELAGRIGDGLISTSPSAAAVKGFEGAGGGGKPRLGQLKVCWARTEEEALEVAMRAWPTSALPSVLNSELATPKQFEDACAAATPEMLERAIVLGPDPERHLEAIHEFVKAGFDHVFVLQVGPEVDGFVRFYEREVMPRLEAVSAGAGAASWRS